MICPCENPHCRETHKNRDDDWLFRVVRQNLTYVMMRTHPDHGDLVMAEEAIHAAIRARYATRPDGPSREDREKALTALLSGVCQSASDVGMPIGVESGALREARELLQLEYP
jgi:hypothetical protein